MLTLQFVRYQEIEGLDSEKRIKLLLEKVKKGKIVLLEGRLKKEEETDLIEGTMKEIDDTFKGVELAVINMENKDAQFLKKIRNNVVSLLLGDRKGFTIIGPAVLIKEIRRDPNKFELLAEEARGKRKK